MTDINVGNDLDGPRPARPDEIPAVLETVNDVLRIRKGRPPNIAQSYPQVYNATNAGNIAIV